MSVRVKNLAELTGKYRNFFFDLDGVIWMGKQKIRGGVEALNFLRQQGRNIFFITNSSIRNRQMLVDRFRSFGFQAKHQQIYPSDYITSLYLKSKYPQLRKVMVVGASNLVEEIRKTGAEVVHMDGVGFDRDHNVSKIIAKMDKSVDSLVMGYDFHLTYQKICLITLYVQSGIPFIGTNPDKYTMVQHLKIPGCGSMLKVIEEATTIKPDIAGKPNPFIINHLIKEMKLERKECLMIGDNLETDIAFGKNAGIDSLCVLTGVTNQQMVLAANSPTYFSQYLL